MRSDLDPILLEVFKNGFEAIADEMALILMRTAHSPIVRDAMDFSTALCDVHGQNLAQGLTTPMHLGSFYDAMRHLIADYAGDIADGAGDGADAVGGIGQAIHHAVGFPRAGNGGARHVRGFGDAAGNFGGGTGHLLNRGRHG